MKADKSMIVDRLGQNELNEVLTLYRSIPGNQDFQINAASFEARCIASLQGKDAQINISDNFCARTVSIFPRVYTFKLKFKDRENDTIIGCATVFKSSLDGFDADDLSIIDLCFRLDVHENTMGGASLGVVYVKNMIYEVYNTFRPEHSIGVYFFDDCDESDRIAGILQSCHFEENFEPSDRLVFVHPPHEDMVPDGCDRTIRPIARHVLDVDRAIDPHEGSVRDVPLSHSRRRRPLA